MESIANQLKLDVVCDTISINGFGGKIESKIYPVVNFKVVSGVTSICAEDIVISKLLDSIIIRGRSDTVKALIAKGIRLADTTSDTDDLSVQLLIGADQYHNFVYTQTSGSMTLTPSRLGTMIAGNIVVRDSAGNSEHSCVEAVTVLRVAAEEDSSLDNIL